MPALILRIVVIAVLAYLAGATVTPLLWGQAMVQEAKTTLSPFAMLSGGILLFGVGYSIKQIFHR
jgi:hypothetical protein